jgi:hypothetical protein
MLRLGFERLYEKVEKVKADVGVCQIFCVNDLAFVVGFGFGFGDGLQGKGRPLPLHIHVEEKN